MKIYIASSWKNQHAVEMLTDHIRAKGHQVHSFVEEVVEKEGRSDLVFDFDQWINSEDGQRKFEYDTEGATKSDLVIYISPSGTDAWAEIGAAWASGVPIIGLHAKGEPSGLMRKMVDWVYNFRELLDVIPVNKSSNRTDAG